MTARTQVVLLDPSLGPQDTLGPDPVSAARERISAGAFRDGPLGQVGLELELHLVDLLDPGTRPPWSRVLELVAAVEAGAPLPGGSSVTLEPGGQVELSTPPKADVTTAVEALLRDERVLRAHAAELGLGLAALGSDPARPSRRVSPGARYIAMERHFEHLSTGGSGLAMMTSTAALQVNLDAGPAAGWHDRMELARSLVPVLVALTSTSPWLGGRTSGWHSMRQGTWDGIDHGRTDPVRSGDPVQEWVDYALRAPLLLVSARHEGEAMTAVTRRVSLEEWLRGDSGLHRAPTARDVDYHLTTLFPPVRPRGYLELRCLDAMPVRWWPAAAAVATALLDDPVAAEVAREACAPVAEAWEAAARLGPAAPAVRRALETCLDVAARRVPAALAPPVSELAELIASGRTPSGELRRQIERSGPVAVLAEHARPDDDDDLDVDLGLDVDPGSAAR